MLQIRATTTPSGDDDDVFDDIWMIDVSLSPTWWSGAGPKLEINNGKVRQ